MLLFSWIIAFLCSIPQSLVFKVMNHPKIADFQQCVSFGTLTEKQEIAYSAIFLSLVFFLPLLIITVCYACIFHEISRNSKEMSALRNPSDGSPIYLRRSDDRLLVRARRRTLRMTVTIVTVFACCWLPHATMALWYMLDRRSAELVSKRVQDILFMMAVSNSCMDPFVYGSYALDLKSTFSRTLRKILCMHTTHPVERPVMSAPGTMKTKVPLNTDVAPIENGTCHHVRFQETSFCSREACSDPSPNWNVSDCELHSIVKSSQSCEVFTLQHQASVEYNRATVLEFERQKSSSKRVY